MRFIVPLVLLGGFGVVGYFGYQSMTADDTEQIDPVSATTTPEAVTTDTAPSSPVVAPIDDADTVVDQLNDNESEDAALEIIGGQRGEAPVTAVPFEPPTEPGIAANADLIAADIIDDDLASVADASAFGYRFQRGTSTTADTVFVDSRTGDRELFDGTAYVRVVGDETFTTLDPTSSWSNDPAARPTDPLLLLTNMITIDEVMPDGFVDVAVATSITDEFGYGRYLFSETSLAELPFGARSLWLTSFGFDPDRPATPSDDLLGDIPERAAAGQVLVSVSGASDGVVTRLVIDAPSLGELVTYDLIGASIDPVDVPTPAID